MATKDQKKVPIRMNDFSVMDSEFGNIRERFDSEMKKMEDEMNKFRTEMLTKDSNLMKNTSSITHSSSETKDGASGKSASTNGAGNNAGGMIGSGLGSHSNWLSGFSSPLIKSSDVEEGQKELKLRFDVSNYSPEEIVVKTVDNKLLVSAKHEEKGEGKAVYREYNREFLLPSGTDPESIRSSLSRDGILTVEAPLPQQAITQEK